VRVGVITRHLGLPVGFGTYAGKLLTTLDRVGSEHEYVVYAPKWNDVPQLGGQFRVRRFPVPRVRSALTGWDLTLAPAAARRDRVDVLHYLHPAYPAINPGRPTVVNLLDAIGWVLPGYRLPQPYELLERRAARRADLVLTLSESARQDISRILGVPRERIRVTYLGAPPVDAPADDREETGAPFFLFVGGTERRKNLRAVLEAFAGIDGMRLLVVGPHSPSPIRDARTDQAGVEWLGHVADAELERLYRGATALVFPSLYEGFGLPVVEAMARRTPVIASNSSSIPEVAGDAAILVDPRDSQAIRDAMQRIAGDSGLQAELTARGVEVARRFSWEATARATLAAYDELCA
jgi:glycosyltransferase involved in cell wall biosynthesis